MTTYLQIENQDAVRFKGTLASVPPERPRASSPASSPPAPKRAVKLWAIPIPLMLLIVIPAVSIGYKVFALDYRLEEIFPEPEYTVTLDMSLDGNLGRVRVQTFLPLSDAHQTISNEHPSSHGTLRFSDDRHGGNREGVWFGSAVPNASHLLYSFSVRTVGQRYELGNDVMVPDTYPASVLTSLRPEDAIQVDAPEITQTLEEINAGQGSARERLHRIYDYTRGLRGRPFKGTTDALTALRLGEASCNGKSRLFAALARAAGIPTRLVGGFILHAGHKRTSHQWVESYVSGHWIPFGPTNNHFAELPANYLVLYRGDKALFRHSSDINFDYEFTTTIRHVPSARSLETFQAFNIWALFSRLGLPFSLLSTVLMLPIGALVVVLFRNVIGVPTFGTFLPALIAAAAGETGLAWGFVAIMVVMFTVAMARLAIQRFGLLHSPTLAILLVVVVMTMLGTSFVAERLNIEPLARITYFPIAVMAIASERFFLALVERGTRDAMTQLAGTMVLVLSCYLVMNSLATQILISGFPEILLWVIAANVYLGRWVGVRVLELWRFRTLIAAEEVSH